MTPDDRRLAALLAAFVPHRAGELAALLGGRHGDEVRAASAALVQGGRSTRLAELSRALAPPRAPPPPSAASPRAGAGRLAERLRLELASSR